MVARIMRLLREDVRIQDALSSFLEGRGEAGQYSFVVPVMMLAKPQQPEE